MTMQSRIMRVARRVFDASLDFYRRTVGWALDNPKTIMFILLVAVVLNVYLLAIVPKGFFPDVDEGRMHGGIRADQSISFQLMQKKFLQFVNIVRADPAVAIDGRLRRRAATNGNLFVTLKPPAQRGYLTTDDVIDRLRPQAEQCRRRAGCSCNRPAPPACAPAAARAMATINIPSRPTRWTISTPGCPRSPTRCRMCPSCRTSIPTSRTRAWKSISRSTAPRRRGWA